ncbi:hypothetical protein OAP14_00660 [Aliiglaciecola sp.]|nr:hypothetical protein [Aliiglaciecola sp.]
MSNPLELSHSQTPEILQAINQEISKALSAEEIDDAKLRLLVTRRDEYVQSYLPELDEIKRAEFAQQELVSNEKLLAIVKVQLSDSLGQLSGLIRGRKAVNKYK